MIKAAIFDFDGTIADSFDLLLDTFRKVAPTYIDKEVPLEELRGLTTSQIMKRLNVKLRQVPLLAIRGKKEMSKGIPKLKTFDHLDGALRELARQNIRLFVISSNDQRSIELFMKANKLSSLWEDVIGDVGLLGKAKPIKGLVRKTGYQPREVVYVGDETRDVAAAKKAGVASIAVGWGFNNEAVLRQAKPDVFVQTPKDLLEAVEDL